MGGRESTGPLNLPLLRRGGAARPGRGNSARQSPGPSGVQHPARRQGRYPHPQQNWVVKNLKLDFNKTNRKGYVQNGGWIQS